MKKAWSLAAALLLSTTTVFAQETTHNAYRLTLTSQATVMVMVRAKTPPGQTQAKPLYQSVQIQSETIVGYSWRNSFCARVLTLHDTSELLQQNGVLISNTFRSSEKFGNSIHGRTEEILAKDAPKAIKTMLEDSFGVPIYKVKIDTEGNETPVNIAKPGAQELIQNGFLANAMLFHPPFLKNQQTWRANKQMSIGNGGYVNGILTYTKLNTDDKGLTKVNVSGVLTNNRFVQNTGLTTRDASYTVNGAQTYNTGLNAWVSGELKIDFSFKIDINDKPAGETKGKMHALLVSTPK